ncbi:MerR family transcriptional regulator [Thomasclavelia sp.]
MPNYKTSEIATIMGVHPNTVRLYEKLELIPIAKRLPNGYRVFTDFHLEQFKLARLALQIEILQNSLRKKIIQVIKASAKRDFDTALSLTKEYLIQIKEEQKNAEEAIIIVKQILSGEFYQNNIQLKRNEVSKYLNISMDSLRNWEMNGLITVKRKQNGYRIYNSDDINRLKIIRCLRCANYSLEAILRLLNQLSKNPNIDIKTVLDTPEADVDIIAVCDKLITSLLSAKNNATKIIAILNKMKKQF